MWGGSLLYAWEDVLLARAGEFPETRRALLATLRTPPIASTPPPTAARRSSTRRPVCPVAPATNTVTGLSAACVSHSITSFYIHEFVVQNARVPRRLLASAWRPRAPTAITAAEPIATRRETGARSASAGATAKINNRQAFIMFLIE